MHSDRIAGYIILAGLTALLLGVGGYALNVLYNPPQKRLVAFDQVGGLQIDDAVKFQGVTIGHITAVFEQDQQVIVEISFPRPVTIYNNYTIIVAEKGILGERFLILEPGSSHHPVIAPEDTLRARFSPGMADYIGQAQRLEPALSAILQTVLRMRHGSPDQPSLISTINTTVDGIDTFTLSLTTLIDTLQTSLKTTVPDLVSLLNGADSMIQSVGTAVTPTVDSLQQTIHRLNAALSTVSGYLVTAAGIIDTLDNPQGILWSTQISQLTGQLHVLQQALQDIANSAARLKLLLSFRH